MSQRPRRDQILARPDVGRGVAVLRRRGWTDSDVEDLFEVFPRLLDDEYSGLLRWAAVVAGLPSDLTADSDTEPDLSPARTIAWMRLLFTAVGSLIHGGRWLHRSDGSCPDLDSYGPAVRRGDCLPIDAYLTAADGDDRLARMAWAGGLTPDELTRQRENGLLDDDEWLVIVADDFSPHPLGPCRQPRIPAG